MPNPSQVIQLGGASGTISAHYSTTIVDPADNNWFWVAMPFIGDASGGLPAGWQTTVNHVP
jgi:hypothetical protein